MCVIWWDTSKVWGVDIGWYGVGWHSKLGVLSEQWAHLTRLLQQNVTEFKVYHGLVVTRVCQLNRTNKKTEHVYTHAHTHRKTSLCCLYISICLITQLLRRKNWCKCLKIQLLYHKQAQISKNKKNVSMRSRDGEISNKIDKSWQELLFGTNLCIVYLLDQDKCFLIEIKVIKKEEETTSVRDWTKTKSMAAFCLQLNWNNGMTWFYAVTSRTKYTFDC